MNTPTTIDISRFNRGLAGLADGLGISGQVVLKKEMGELLKTLVRVTPPREPSKTRASIDANLTGTFSSLAAEHRSYSGTDAKVGSTGIKWYAWDNKHLFGVAPESDMRESDQSTLLKVYYRTYRRKSGRAYIELPFNHPRKIQRVAISTKLLTTKKQVRGLATKIKGHVGRLKAGWLAAWDRVKPTGGNMPPNWVWKHKSGAKGYFIDGLTSKDFPTFTIANTALGVTNKKNNVGWIVTNALNIRGKAMAKNLTLFMRGKKNLSDYAQGHARN